MARRSIATSALPVGNRIALRCGVSSKIFETFEKSFTGRRRYPNIRITVLSKNNAPVGGNNGRSDGRMASSSCLGCNDGKRRRSGRAVDRTCGALGQAGEGGRHAVADRLPCPDRRGPQDRVGDHDRGDQRPERFPGTSRGIRAARRPVQARDGAQPLREADHRRQGRPDPGAVRHGADPGGDGRGPALRQGDDPEQHGHSQAADLRPRLSGDAVRTRAERHLSQRHPRRDGDLPDATQDHGDPDVEVPVGAVHGAGHEGAGREAGREGAALSRI